MMLKHRYLLTSVVILFLYSITHSQSINKSDTKLTVLRQAAEFESQEAIWLIWPDYEHKAGLSNNAVTTYIISEIIEYVPVFVSCYSSEALQDATEKLNSLFGDHPNLTLVEIPSGEIWIRDMGPNLVFTKELGPAVVDYKFNSWGYGDLSDDDTRLDEAYDRKWAEKYGYPVITSPIISEGGNREHNGKGTLILTETVALGRNPSWTKAQLEEEFERTLGVSHIIWLKEGLREDDHTFRGPFAGFDGRFYYTVATTNGHVDKFVRFVNPTTILLAEVPEEALEDPFGIENHRRLEENYEILKNAVDQDGNPFTIIRMPMPTLLMDKMRPGDPVYDYIKTMSYNSGIPFPQGKHIPVVPTASYLNFLITDSVIVGQKYWNEGASFVLKKRDNEVYEILKSQFPNRKVVLIDAYAINLGGGGIHCITMNKPKYNRY